MAVKPIPQGYHSITPYLVCRGAAQAIEFYRQAFGAVELFRLPGPNGVVMHAEIKIGDSIIMLAEENLEYQAKSPQLLGGSPVSLLLYVENVDEVFPRALAAGATEVRPIANQFYGDRSGTLTDPSGHSWSIATHIEDVTPEEMNRRMASYKQS